MSIQVHEWLAMIVGVHRAMPESERRALELWESENLGKGYATSDWPGWLKYVGPFPKSPPRPVTQPKARIARRLRTRIFERDGYRCRHCGGWAFLSVDHIVPESRGGTLDPDNLQTLCRSCNSRKGVR